MYTTRMVSLLSGASFSQLRHWRIDSGHGALIAPSGVRGRQALYSFQDVVALRMFVVLRQKTSLQKIRKSVG